MSGKDNVSPNILKVRDDNEPIYFNIVDNKICTNGSDDSILDWYSETNYYKADLRTHIEPWLTSLFQSEHLSLLVGSGFTTAIQYLASDKSDNGMSSGEFTVFGDEIKKAAKESAVKSNRGEANIEDRIRVANNLINGLEIIKGSPAYPDIEKKLDTLHSELEVILKNFTDNIFKIENTIASADPDKKEDAFNKLVQFLMSFSSRPGTRDRLNIFTTNYDRLIEAGADVAGLRLIDRFVGSLSPIFRSSRLDIDMHYNPPGIRGEPRYLEGVAHFTKLHGSLDWINCGDDIRKIGLPFGVESIDPFLNAAGFNTGYSNLMIYPNSAKDRETAEYPYVELFRDFAAALCRPNSTLVTYGYSFGDDHINRVIRDMLTIPSTHLVIINYDDRSGRVMDKYNRWGHKSQISLIVGKDIANINDLVDYYLPKPSIDLATVKMSEILRQRFDLQTRKDEEGERSV